MPIYAIRSEDLYVQNAERIIVPRELEGIIMPTQWAAICAGMSSSRSQATMMSCCTEFLICLIFVFPPIFCCHPCFYHLYSQCYMERQAKSLNATLFQGQPVLAFGSGILTVNSDYLAQPQVAVYTMRSNPAVTSILHEKVDDPPMAAVHCPVSAQDDTASYVEVVASPVAVETRSMYVVIPGNAGPGSVLTVVAPNGAKLTVVCPPDTRPGSQILVNY